MQRPSFLGEENILSQKSRIFNKLLFYLLIFSDEIVPRDCVNYSLTRFK